MLSDLQKQLIPERFSSRYGGILDSHVTADHLTYTKGRMTDFAISDEGHIKQFRWEYVTIIGKQSGVSIKCSDVLFYYSPYENEADVDPIIHSQYFNSQYIQGMVNKQFGGRFIILFSDENQKDEFVKLTESNK